MVKGKFCGHFSDRVAFFWNTLYYDHVFLVVIKNFSRIISVAYYLYDAGTFHLIRMMLDEYLLLITETRFHKEEKMNLQKLSEQMIKGKDLCS